MISVNSSFEDEGTTLFVEGSLSKESSRGVGEGGRRESGAV